MRFALIAAFASVAIACLGLTACIGLSCTEEAKPSIEVTVVDSMGNTLKDARVRFSVDGGAEQPAECVSLSGVGMGSCDSWVAAYEMTGLFTVKASSADGQKNVQTSVRVTADECHVKSQALTLTL